MWEGPVHPGRIYMLHNSHIFELEYGLLLSKKVYMSADSQLHSIRPCMSYILCIYYMLTFLEDMRPCHARIFNVMLIIIGI